MSSNHPVFCSEKPQRLSCKQLRVKLFQGTKWCRSCWWLLRKMCVFLCWCRIFLVGCRFFFGGGVGLCHCASAPDNALRCWVWCAIASEVSSSLGRIYIKNIKKLLFKMPSWRSFYSGTKRQQVWTCVKSQVKQSRWSQAFHTRYTPLTNITLENLQFWIGNTSSHGWFSIVMLVFGWVNVLRFKVKHLQNQIRKTGSKLLHQKSCTSIVHLSYLISIVSYPYISSLHMIHPCEFRQQLNSLFAKQTKQKKSVSVKSVALELNHVGINLTPLDPAIPEASPPLWHLWSSVGSCWRKWWTPQIRPLELI